MLSGISWFCVTIMRAEDDAYLRRLANKELLNNPWIKGVPIEWLSLPRSDNGSFGHWNEGESM